MGKLFPELSERQLDILKGIAHGFTNEYIGQRHDINVRTVEYHVSQIIDKLIDEDAHINLPHLNTRARLAHLFYKRVGEQFMEAVRGS
jgi:DNA-binding NarL/FixJ family response regulator